MNTGNNQTALAYELVKTYWAGRYAQQSGLSYMKHIDDGLRILDALNADDSTKAAYCLHPLYQGESDPDNHPLMLRHTGQFSDETLLYARDYARVANSYLSRHCRDSNDPVPLSTHKAVNDMLIADKVQNRYDFLYLNPELHKSRPDHAGKLTLYFNNWLRALGIDDEKLAALEKLVASAAPYEEKNAPRTPRDSSKNRSRHSHP